MSEKKERHEWVKDVDGKYCRKCGSRVNTTIGLPRYKERDEWGVLEYVNWYPACRGKKMMKRGKNERKQ